MTEIKAKVVEFTLEKHPDADTLSIAHIANTAWQCIVRTSDFENIKFGIYCPIDALVPTTHSMFAFLDKKGDKKPFRIKTIKLRGQLSQGLLLPAPEGAILGDDLTEQLGVTRWEPPIPNHLSKLFAGDTIREPTSFQKYTSIENYKNYPDVFVEGEQVRITEKQHGSNHRVGYIKNGDEFTYIVGSHRTARSKDGNNLYSKMAQKLQLEEKLKPLLEEFQPKENFIVYGEVYGWGVQDLTYDCESGEQKLRLFDVLIDHKYQSWSIVEKVAKTIGIETVPLLYRGPFALQKALQLRDGATTLGERHVREGVVVTAEPEAFHPKIGRKIIKFISDDYLLRKNATDYAA